MKLLIRSTRPVSTSTLGPLLWMLLSISLTFAGLGMLLQARSHATTYPTEVNTRKVRGKSGNPTLYVDPHRYQLGIGLVGIGLVSTMVSGWVWGQRVDSDRAGQSA